MCFDLDSRPPIEPMAGGAIDSEEVILRAGDGGRFAGLLARAETPSGAAIIVLPDVRGLHLYYEELALRLRRGGRGRARDRLLRGGTAGDRDP